MAKFNKINQIVVIGSTGLLGQALKTEARKREVDLVGIARRGAEYSVDATEKKNRALNEQIVTVRKHINQRIRQDKKDSE